MGVMGSTDVASYERKEIRALTGGEKAVPITLAAQTADLEEGTILGVVTATGIFDVYKDTNTDGTNVAKVILAEYAEASTTTQVVSAYINVVAYKDKLVGLDSAAMADFGAREVVPGIIVIQSANDLRIVRIAGAGYAPASLTLKDATKDTPADSVVVEATSPGVWGNGLTASVALNAKNGIDITVTDGD